MAAATLNHVIDQGSTFTKIIAIKNSATLIYIDLATYEFRGQLRTTAASGDIAATLTFVKNPDQTVTMSLTAAQTDLLLLPKYVYDVEMFTAADATVAKILKGTFQVLPQVTR